MQPDIVAPVSRGALKDHVRQALQRYWPDNDSLLDRLAVPECRFPRATAPLSLVLVRLPDWAAQFGIDGCLAVPREACAGSETPNWNEVDWWLAAFLMLEGWHERMWEQAHGAVHSYSFRLTGWDQRVWKRAWVNRIALFLRAWAAIEIGRDANVVFGPLPAPEIVVTHDVDAVSKTVAIRLKQSAFLALNAVRLAVAAKPRAALARLSQAARFLLGRDDWWMFDTVIDAERAVGIRSIFNFYADDRPKNLRRWVFDPGYDITQARLSELLQRLLRAGWRVGLHQSHDAWQSAELMRRQRERLQSIVAEPVTSCRQHWLRFSWRDTWTAQSAAGLELDTTLMFNDRPGLRSAAALRWSPWNPREGRPHSLSALTTVLMDSHFYDYQPMTATERRSALRDWLDEVVAVGGQVAVLWHPHTLSRDYGWAEGFRELLAELSARTRCTGS